MRLFRPRPVPNPGLELALRAIQNRAPMHDIHATVLHLLGMDHERLTYPHNGRESKPGWGIS